MPQKGDTSLEVSVAKVGARVQGGVASIHKHHLNIGAQLPHLLCKTLRIVHWILLGLWEDDAFVDCTVPLSP